MEGGNKPTASTEPQMFNFATHSPRQIAANARTEAASLRLEAEFATANEEFYKVVDAGGDVAEAARICAARQAAADTKFGERHNGF